MSKIIEMKKLPSGSTVIASDVEQGVGIEIGTGVIFLSEDDIFGFIQFLKNVDKYYLVKG